MTAQVGGSNFSALGNEKYMKICLVVYYGNIQSPSKFCNILKKRISERLGVFFGKDFETCFFNFLSKSLIFQKS
jgi:hypothetical protein